MNTKPLVLPYDDPFLVEAWAALDKSGLPMELKQLVREIIVCHNNGYQMPLATPRLIQLAKEHLQGGIHFGDQKYYNVEVFVPDNSTTHRYFFVLVHKYPNGTLVSLAKA